jgi:hypothetical protein
VSEELEQPNETPLGDSELETLAREIEEEHNKAEACMLDSLEHARMAGVKLIEVREKLRNKGFVRWVQDKCGFSIATAYLYMKVAKEWNRLGDLQRVRKVTLRQAAQLLQMDDDEDFAAEIGMVASLRIVKESQLEDLAPIERRAFVREMKDLYEYSCCDDFEHKVLDEIKAKRIACDWSPPAVMYSLRAIQTLAQQMLVEFKNGDITMFSVQKRARKLERIVEKIEKQHSSPEENCWADQDYGGSPNPDSASNAQEKAEAQTPEADSKSDAQEKAIARTRNQPRARRTGPKVKVSVDTPFWYYVHLCDRFRGATRDLIKGPHGVLSYFSDEPLDWGTRELENIQTCINAVRESLNVLEGEVGDRMKENYSKLCEAIRELEIAEGPDTLPEYPEDVDESELETLAREIEASKTESRTSPSVSISSPPFQIGFGS